MEQTWRGFGPDDVATLAQVNVVIQILAGGRNCGRDTGLLK